MEQEIREPAPVARWIRMLAWVIIVTSLLAVFSGGLILFGEEQLPSLNWPRVIFSVLAMIWLLPVFWIVAITGRPPKSWFGLGTRLWRSDHLITGNVIVDPLHTKRKGYLRVVTIRGIPLFIHWSFPSGGLLVSVYGGFNLLEAVYIIAGYVLIIAVHECGHAVAARLLGLKVFAVYISGAGGLCAIELPRRVNHGVIVYSAGILAEILLLLFTLIYVSIFGPPETRFGQCLVICFTIVNAVLIVLNLIPGQSTRGILTDGYVLWKLILHILLKHPLPAQIVLSGEQSPVFPPDTRLLSRPSLVPSGFKTGIEILNDSKTPMEFVVTTLMQHLELDQSRATTMMLHIHNNGGLLVPLPSKEKAEKVAACITAEARQNGFSFTCRAVDVKN